MNIFGKTFGLLVGLALLGVLGAGGYFALEFVVSLFASLEVQVARVTAIASAVALLAAFIIASAIRDAGRKNNAAQILEQVLAEMRKGSGSGSHGIAGGHLQPLISPASGSIGTRAPHR
jgi:uncharacterized membrane protein